MDNFFAFGFGISTLSEKGMELDCYFPKPIIDVDSETEDVLDELAIGAHEISAETAELLGRNAKSLQIPSIIPRPNKKLVYVKLTEDVEIRSTPEAYLKLHLLSHRLRMPNSLNLNGLFNHLPNVCWTSNGPIATDEIGDALEESRVNGEHLEIFSVDKFPKMVNYVVPSGVRIADSSRIRLGAYLGDGTTVMHEGFINFNAGAMGPNMVEGRISQGVTLGSGSDLGGSASTMGTLSGGGNIVISIGENCLIGANAGTGIPLGDRCTIEAGLYITANSPVTVLDKNRASVKVVKARNLAGKSDLLFIRDGQSGAITCRTNQNTIELNAELHDLN